MAATRKALRPSEAFQITATALLIAVTVAAERSQAADGPVVGWDHGQPILIPSAVDGTIGTAIAIAAGWDHGCAIQAGIHRVICWGDAEPMPPESVNGVGGTASAIAAGWEWSCAIRAENGGVVCWGSSSLNGAPPDSVNGIAGSARAIAVGSNHSCAIQAGTDVLVCWNAASASLPVPDTLNGNAGTAQAVAVGDQITFAHKEVYSCGIQAETRAVTCWRSGSYTPLVVPDSASPAEAVEIGGTNACVIRVGSRAVYCWDLWGGSAIPVPDAVNGVGGTARALAVGLSNCAIQAGTGAPLCWRNNGYLEPPPPPSVDGVGGRADALAVLGQVLAIQARACGDQLDNDGDGLADFPDDPGCMSDASVRENPQCDDDLDNDGDATIDWDGGSAAATPDSVCAGKPWRNREASGCGLGGEIAFALAGLALARRRPRLAGHNPRTKQDRSTAPGHHRGIAWLIVPFLLIAPEALAGRWRFQSPAEPGSYGVGHSVFEVVDPARGDRTLPVDVWYPVDPENAEGTPTFYDFLVFLAGVQSDVSLDDAQPIGTNGFPLVVYSHGGNGLGVEAGTLDEALASHGFVVAAPGHPGDRWQEVQAPFETRRRDRLLDVSIVIDRMLARNVDPLDPLYLRINPAYIGVVGWSIGGWTATQLVSGHSEPAFGTEVPPDPRVRAVAALASGSGDYESPEAEIVAIDVPLLLVSSPGDPEGVDSDTLRPWNLATGRPLYRVDPLGATHGMFGLGCDFGESLISDLGVPLSGVISLFRNYGFDFAGDCRSPSLPIPELKRIRDFYATAFLQRHLLGDPRYDEFLTPDYAVLHEPGVMFQRRDAGQP